MTGWTNAKFATKDKNKRDWDVFFEILGSLPSECKVLIVSRPHNWYNDKLYQKLGNVINEMVITVKDNADDLHDFATYQVRKYAEANQWSAQLEGQTLELTLTKANGNLMWVQLLCETFQFADSESIQSILDALPDGLGELYGRALDNLSKQNKGLAAKVRLALKWILCSYRPLRMSELETVLSMSTAAVKENIIKFIGPLVRIEGDKSLIRLVHASARDFLVSPEAKIFEESSASVPDQLAGIHAAILKSCLEYLTAESRDFVHVGPNQDASEARFRKHVDGDHLLEYSCNGWILHFVEAFKCPGVLQDVKPQLGRMLNSDTAVVKWLQTFHFLWNVYAPSDPARYSMGALTFHPRGTHDWADFLTTEYPFFVRHLSWEDGQRYTRWDRFMHRRHDYSLHHPFSMYQSPRVMPAIAVAAFFDYDELVKNMMKSGTDVNHRGPHAGTPLHWAAAGGSCNSIQALIDAGADKEARHGRHRETPIFKGIRVPKAVPVRAGHYPAARMLCDEGVSLEHEPDSNGFLVSTALIALVEEGPDCAGAAAFAADLCRRDRAAYWYYMRLGTISQVAAWHNRQMILKALLQSDIQKEKINEQGVETRLRAVLHDACTQDNREITKILLKLEQIPI